MREGNQFKRSRKVYHWENNSIKERKIRRINEDFAAENRGGLTFDRRRKGFGKPGIAKFFGTILSVYILLFTVSVLFGSRGRAIAGSDASDVELYLNYVTVQPGDTLWSIAKSHHSEFYPNTFEYVLAIKECNGLKGDLIKPGMNIMVPYTERR